MGNRCSIASDVGRFVLAAVFLTMTMAFLTVPYALSFHPGEAMANTSGSLYRPA